MAGVTVLCVWTGDKYPVQYVQRLFNQVKAHLSVPFDFVCLTDHKAVPEGVILSDVTGLGLEGWWAKMALFHHKARLSRNVALFFDLDTLILSDLQPLVDLAAHESFSICANFTRAAGVTTWPCKYGSCVMTFGSGFGWDTWHFFWRAKDKWMTQAGQYGDQYVIEMIVPGATLIQDKLPGFVRSYRDITEEGPPEGAAVIAFGGNHRPHNSPFKWVFDAWSVG